MYRIKTDIRQYVCKSRDKAERLIRNWVIRPSDLVYDDDGQYWRPIGQHREFVEIFASLEQPDIDQPATVIKDDVARTAAADRADPSPDEDPTPAPPVASDDVEGVAHDPDEITMMTDRTLDRLMVDGEPPSTSDPAGPADSSSEPSAEADDESNDGESARQAPGRRHGLPEDFFSTAELTDDDTDDVEEDTNRRDDLATVEDDANPWSGTSRSNWNIVLDKMPPEGEQQEQQISEVDAAKAFPTPESITQSRLDKMPPRTSEDSPEDLNASPDYDIEPIDDEAPESPLDPDALEDRLLAPDPDDPNVDKAFDDWEQAAANTEDTTDEDTDEDDLETVTILEALPDHDAPSLGYDVEFTEPIKPSVAALRIGIQQQSLPEISRDRYFSLPRPKDGGHLAHSEYDLSSSDPPAWKLRLDDWRAPASWSQTRMLSVAVGLALGVVLLLMLGIAAC